VESNTKSESCTASLKGLLVFSSTLWTQQTCNRNLTGRQRCVKAMLSAVQKV